MKTTTTLLAAGFTYLLGSMIASHAQVIPVTNFSFENPVLNSSNSTSYNGGYYMTVNDGSIPGWTMADGSFGVGLQTINSGNFTSAGASDGQNYAWINYLSSNLAGPSSITSTSALGTIVAGTDYTLTVALGNESNGSGGGEAGIETIQLLAGSTPFSVSYNETQLPIGTFTDENVTLTAAQIAADGLVGQSLGIRLTGTVYGSDVFDQNAFDNVQLTEASVPEPSTFAMIIGAVAALALIYFRRTLA